MNEAQRITLAAEDARTDIPPMQKVRRVVTRKTEGHILLRYVPREPILTGDDTR